MDKTCLEDIIFLMIEDYEIGFEDEMSLTEYEEMIIKGIDEIFEKKYNKHIKEREDEE